MFENLSQKLQDTLTKVAGQGKLTEEAVKSALRELKLALLEADVNLQIVKEFIIAIQEKAVGLPLEKGVNPKNLFMQFVHDQLVEIMGGGIEDIAIARGGMTRVMMVGLQGSGKTTTSGKLALRFKKHNPLLVACDVYRPAAVDQLKTVASQSGVQCYEKGVGESPVLIAKEALEVASKGGHQFVIFDTAGRLQIDEELMQELVCMKQTVDPHEILLVIDSMTGQEAVRVASAFDQKLGLSGVILTKVDGDARGGVALSVRKTVGKPVKYIGISEKLDGLELFDPQRMAGRILGMGDLTGLLEKAGSVMDESVAKRMQRRMGSGEFNFVDFLQQLEMMKKMGPIEDLLKMIPGMGNFTEQMGGVGKEMKKTVAIIQSMTVQERVQPEILNASRRKRIAKGAGATVQDINQLIRQFDQMKQVMKQFKKMGLFNPAKLAGGKLPFRF